MMFAKKEIEENMEIDPAVLEEHSDILAGIILETTKKYSEIYLNRFDQRTVSNIVFSALLGAIGTNVE